MKFRSSLVVSALLASGLSAAYGCSGTNGDGQRTVYVIAENDSGTGQGGSAGAGGGYQDDSGTTIKIDGGPEGGGSLDMDGDVCVAEQQKATPIPLNMYIMLDRSGSMSSKWGAVTGALKTFAQDPGSADLRVALNYFPADTNDCSALGYATPAVNLGTLTKDPAPADAQEQKLVESLSSTQTTGVTPMAPAYIGLIGYCYDLALELKNAGKSEKVVAVLVTDGDPTSCSGFPSDAISYIKNQAEQSYKTDPQVITFTIGLTGSNEADLRDIASAGGGEALFVGSQSIQQDFLDRLHAISGGLLSCEYLLPTEDGHGQSVDYGKVSVQHTPGTGAASELVKVDDESKCVLNGWYYDDNKNPSKILLCPSTCDMVQADAQSEVEVLLGCAPKVQ